MKSASFLERLDDSINPIVVKELRQAVQSRLVIIVLLLFLLLQFLFIASYMLVMVNDGQLNRIDFQAGRNAFTALQGILLGTCMLFLPIYTGVRLAAERNEVNTDLLFITTLKPGSIITGKIISSTILALLIFSACTPFMLFTYFLRGIDWPSIAYIITVDFLVVIGSVHVIVFLAVIPTNRIVKAFLGLVGLGLLVMIFSWAIAGTVNMLWWGMSAALMESRDFWLGSGLGVLAFLGIIGLFFTWSVSLICPPSSNRAFAHRIYMMILFVISAAAMIAFAFYIRNFGPVAVWLGFIASLWSLNLIISVNERTQLSPRIRRTIPASPLLRLPAFLVYSGAASGVTMTMVMAGLTAGVYWLTQAIGQEYSVRYDSDYTDVFNVFTVMFLFTYCYAMTSVFLTDRILPRSLAGYNWLVIILLVAIGSLIPMFTGMLIHFDTFRPDRYHYWMVTNPAWVMAEFVESRRSTGRLDDYWFVLAVWTALVTLINLPWLIRQIRNFRSSIDANAPISEQAILPTEPETAPSSRDRTREAAPDPLTP